MLQLLRSEAVRRSMRRLKRDQNRAFYKLLVLADVGRALPSTALLDELRAAGFDDLVERFGELAARVVELRCGVLRERN